MRQIPPRHQPRPGQPEGSVKTTGWRPMPVARANTSALSLTAFTMLLLTRFEPEGVDAMDFIRGGAIFLMVAHAGFHVLMLNALKLMDVLEIAEAKHALETYRDPHRLSHLDLAAIWFGFYALAPYAM